MPPPRRKTDVKSELESVVRCLSGEELIKALTERVIASEEEKATLTSKLEELLQIQKDSVQLRKQNEMLTKKLNTQKAILMKTELAKGKLESLCREMQVAQKKMHDDHVEKLRSFENGRKEMIEKFKASIATVQKSMEAGRETSNRLTNDNAELAEKLKALASEYETKVSLLSKQFSEKKDYCEKLTVARDMEVDLYKAKLDAADLTLQKAEHEKLQLQNELLARDIRMKEALESEKQMREQIEKYTKKYNELHTSLSNSNETFDKFKHEMERMNSNLINVEKDCRKWRSKYEDSVKSLAVITLQKRESDEVCGLKERQLQQLQSLCRALQSQIENK